MLNICYWDINTGIIKTAQYDSKDKIKYDDNIENRSPALAHHIKVFTGSYNHTTKPEKVEVHLNSVASPSLNNVLNEILQNSPLLYTVSKVVATKVIVPRKEQQRINRLFNKINKMKPANR